MERPSFLIKLFVTSGVANFSTGLCLAGYNSVGLLIESKEDWDRSQTVNITACGILGLMIGALSAERVLVIGRIKAAYLANLVIILSVFPMMLLNFYSLALGRLMLGIGSGLFTVITSVYMAEVLTPINLGRTATSINLGIVIGIFISSLTQGLLLPSLSDTQAVKQTQNWRNVFIMPGFFALINLLMWLYLIKFDSLHFLINSQQDEKREMQAFKFFTSICSFKNEQQAKESFQQLKSSLSCKKEANSNEKLGFFAIFNKQYRAGSLFLVFGAIIAQCTGINAINIYSSVILRQIPGLPTTLGILILSLSNIIGSFLALPLTNWLSIKQLLVVGQFTIALFLGLVALFSYLEQPVCILVSMVCVLFTGQMTNGAYYFPYVSQIANEQQDAFAKFAFWTTVLAISLVTSPLMVQIGVIGVFASFGTISFLGGLYFMFFMKETKGLSSMQSKQAFHPECYKQDTDDFINADQERNSDILILRNSGSKN